MKVIRSDGPGLGSITKGVDPISDNMMSVDMLLCYMGGSQNYGPVLGPYYNTAPNTLRYPNRGHNFDNYPYDMI